MTVFELLDQQEAGSGSIGPTLRRAREAAGYSVSDIAERMCLSRRNIEDMEAERFDLFPVPVFLRGYLANYARVVGIDPEPLLEEYGRRGFGPPDLHSKSSERTTTRSPEITVIATTVVVVTVLVVLTALWWRDQWTGDDGLPPPAAVQPGGEGAPREGGKRPGEPAVEAAVPAAASGPEEPPAREDGAEAPVVGSPPTVAAEAEPVPAGAGGETPTEPAPRRSEGSEGRAEAGADEGAAPAAPGSGEPGAAGEAGRPADGEGELASLVIRVREDCWLMVRDADERLIYRNLAPAGTVLDLRARPPVRIVAGYASGIEIEYDGEPFDLSPFVEQDTGTARFHLGS